jgi:peptidoglycan/LPS O-acetylase OafA/YrhL
VLIYHSHDFVATAGWPLVRMGWIGVDIFFVLSGFIISHVHLNDFIRLSTAAIGRFLALRLSRIYTVHIATLFIALLLLAERLLLGNTASTARFSFDSFIANLLLVQAWASDRLTWNYVSWSISAEWGAYLVFPLVALGLSRLRSPIVALAGAALSLAAMIAILNSLGMSSMAVETRYALIRAAGSFLAGCFLYAAYRTDKLDGLPWGLITTLAFLVLAVQVVVFDESFWAMPTIATLVLGLAYGRGTVAEAFSGTLAVSLGEVSYSLYMVHFLVIETVMRPIGLTRYGSSAILVDACYIIALVATAAVTWLMYRRIEKPSRNAARRLIERWLPPAPSARA